MMKRLLKALIVFMLCMAVFAGTVVANGEKDASKTDGMTSGEAKYIKLVDSIIVNRAVADAPSGNLRMTNDIKTLAYYGFTKNDFMVLGEMDTAIVANLIRTEDFNPEELAALRKGWVESRPQSVDACLENQICAPIVEGQASLPDGSTNPVPHATNPYKKFTHIQKSLITSSEAASTGVHLITSSVTDKKFCMQTGYVTLPDVSKTYSTDSNRTRPYVMFGAYQTVPPYAGLDCGLVYYDQHPSWDGVGWKLFASNSATGAWAENASSSPTIRPNASGSGPKVYLTMQFQDADKGYHVLVSVRDVETWKIIEQIVCPMSAAFNTNPHNITLTRETAIAQDVRVDNGSELRGAKWEDVYLYGPVVVTRATDAYLRSQIGANRFSWPYNNSPKYIFGDERGDLAHIGVTNSTKYYGETVNIFLH